MGPTPLLLAPLLLELLLVLLLVLLVPPPLVLLVLLVLLALLLLLPPEVLLPLLVLPPLLPELAVAPPPPPPPQETSGKITANVAMVPIKRCPFVICPALPRGWQRHLPTHSSTANHHTWGTAQFSIQTQVGPPTNGHPTADLPATDIYANTHGN